MPGALITSRMPGTLIASTSGTPRIADGTISAALATSFIHFAERMSSETSTVPAWRSTSATSSSRPRVASSKAPTPNQVPERRRLPFDDAGLEHVAGDLDHRAEGALGADDRGRHVVQRHPVLDADDQPVGREQRLDQLAGPARVVGLDDDQDDVERLAQRRHLAEVEGRTGVVCVSSGISTRMPLARIASTWAGHCSMKVTSSPGARHVGAERGPVGAGPDDCDPLAALRARATRIH